jgi:polyisoprenoid-binding protein YceI
VVERPEVVRARLLRRRGGVTANTATGVVERMLGHAANGFEKRRNARSLGETVTQTGVEITNTQTPNLTARRPQQMTTNSQTLTGTFVADPVHSSFGFAVKYLGGATFRAGFESVTAKLTIDPDGPSLAGAAVTESVSIRTPEPFRGHVLGDDFFSADKHPEITFESDRVELSPDGSATVEGRLTIKGVAKSVTATGTWSPPAADPMGHQRSHLALETTVNRRDFGITWDAPLPGGGSALGDDVTITTDLALVAQD